MKENDGTKRNKIGRKEMIWNEMKRNEVGQMKQNRTKGTKWDKMGRREQKKMK